MNVRKIARIFLVIVFISIVISLIKLSLGIYYSNSKEPPLLFNGEPGDVIASVVVEIQYDDDARVTWYGSAEQKDNISMGDTSEQATADYKLIMLPKSPRTASMDKKINAVDRQMDKAVV